MNQVNKKVLQATNENKITTKDIFTRSKYWEKPNLEKIDKWGVTTTEINPNYRNLKIYTKWQWWQPNYKFLPTPDKFVEIKKDFLEKDWEELENIPHYILRNKNNTLTIIFQNRGQYDFADPRIVLFYGRNTLSEDTKKRNEKANRKGVEYPGLYFITGWDYIDNRSLLCQLTVSKDPIWANYGDMVNSKGTAKISCSQFNNDHLNKEGKVIKNQTEHWPQDEDWKDASGDENTPTHQCPACNNCYDFCGDLREKRAVSVGYSTQGRSAQWQPDFKLLYTIFPSSYEKLAGLMTKPEEKDITVVTITADECKACKNTNPSCNAGKGGGHDYPLVCAVPSNLKLGKWRKGDEETMLTNAKVPSLLFIVDAGHEGKDDKGKVVEGVACGSPKRFPENNKNYFWEELPKCYHEQPHLLNHSSAQFYFQKKLLFTANLKHLLVKRKNPGFQLGYRILIRSSISGILYCFESLDIFYKWELKISGSIQDTTLLNSIIGSVADSAFNKAGKWIGKKVGEGLKKATRAAFAFFTGGTSEATGAGKAVTDGGGQDKIVEAIEKIADALKKGSEGGGAFGDVLTAEKYANALNVNPEGGKQQNDDKPEKEAQTDRKKKSTGKSQERVVEPAIFYASTVDFSYDFWEFSNRCVANPFMIRFEHSEVLYNNLANNNNTSPIQNIQCRFSAFKQCIKVGEWQGNIDLFYDINNTLTNACGSGTFFYDDEKELFQPWRPKYKTLQSFTHGDTFNSGTVPGQEDVEYIPGEEKKEKVKEVPANSAVWVCSMIGAPNWGCTRKEDNLAGGYKWYGTGGHMGIFPVDNPNKDYFSELCAEDMNANSTNPGVGAANSTGWNLKAGLNFSKDYDIPRGRYNIYWHCKGLQAFPDEGKEINGFTLILGDATTNLITWLKTETEGSYNRRFVIEGITAEREKEFAIKESQEPEWTDNNTQFSSNIGETDPEALEKLQEFDQELKETQLDKPETDLKEKSGEAEKDFEKELEKQKEAEKDREKERQLEKELEKEREKDREKERDLEKEKQKDREKQTEREKKQREAQLERDKKDQERKDRETKLREKQQQQKEKARSEKEKKDKEKKERE